VVDVSAEVERERLLQPDDGAEVVLLPGGGQLLERVVQAVDVGLVVLGVVQLQISPVMCGASAP
jgi:hypothetical protein